MTLNTRPLFIVIEGIDGSGKTTQIDILKTRFKELGLKATDTFEPTDGPIGGIIRNTMRGRSEFHPSAMAALFLADRLDHIHNPVNGMLKRMDEGFHIICSRYYFSNYAFQGEYVPLDWLVNCNSICKKTLKPDFVFYISVDPKICNERLKKNRVNIEMYENLKKLTHTHQVFLEVFEKYGSDENIHIIDGEMSIEAISEAIWKLVSEKI